MKPRISQLGQSGATDGQVVTWDGTLGEWVPADGGSGSVPTAVAKGDLIVATGAGTFAILPRSPNTGATLVTDPTTATGLAWSGGTSPAATYDTAVYDTAVYG